MTDPRTDRLTTLGLLWAAWEGQGRALAAERWQQPTRLGDWTVRMLYAHAAGWPVGLSHLVGQAREVAPTHASAAALLADFNRPGGMATTQADRVAAAAREDAAIYTPAQMLEQFAVTGPQAIATARQLGPVVVDYFGRAMLPLEEAVSIGILEATVHLLDLQRALDVPPDVPPAGLEHTVGLLARMTPPVDFIELATGRSEVALFPVLR
jgi:uncharacterized protein (TIGR03083 family)